MDNNTKKKIIGFKSAKGGYFEIWKDECDVIRFKNSYTEIPNEFQKYNVSDNGRKFDYLSREITYCRPVEVASGHPNSSVYVMYSDGTLQLFQHQKGYCFAADFDTYSDFLSKNSRIWGGTPITIEHVRQACSAKVESILNLIKYLDEEQIGDDYISFHRNTDKNGIIKITKEVYGSNYPFMKIFPDGKWECLDVLSRYPYLELLKEYDVRLKVEL